MKSFCQGCERHVRKCGKLFKYLYTPRRLLYFCVDCIEKAEKIKANHIPERERIVMNIRAAYTRITA